MAEFSIGEKIIKLEANEGGYLIKISTVRDCWAYKTYGMKVADYWNALHFFCETVREWLNEYECDNKVENES